jgi:single-strand DNA-binding protein
MNNVSLIGRLTQDPELRTTSTGLSTTRFSIAVDGRPTASGERTTNFINIVAWRGQAENVCKYCHKGSQVGVQGYIQTGSYTAQDGTKRYTTDVVANQVTFLGSKASGDAAETNYEVSNDAPVETADLSEDPYADMGEETVLSDDDLPF